MSDVVDLHRMIMVRIDRMQAQIDELKRELVELKQAVSQQSEPPWDKTREEIR